MEWSAQTDTSFSTVPTINLYHQRPGWKVAVALNPAPTAAGASTTVWLNLANADSHASVKNGGNGVNAVTAGEMIDVVVEARDMYGNQRGIGEHNGGTGTGTGAGAGGGGGGGLQ